MTINTFFLLLKKFFFTNWCLRSFTRSVGKDSPVCCLVLMPIPCANLLICANFFHWNWVTTVFHGPAISFFLYYEFSSFFLWQKLKKESGREWGNVVSKKRGKGRFGFWNIFEIFFLKINFEAQRNTGLNVFKIISAVLINFPRNDELSTSRETARR